MIARLLEIAAIAIFVAWPWWIGACDIIGSACERGRPPDLSP